MTKLLLVGAGNMGYALLAGWMKMQDRPQVSVVEPYEALRDRAAGLASDAFASLDHLAADYAPDVVVLAVKPQVIADVLQGYRRFENACFVSVAAGTTLATLAAGLGDVAIARVMPNTPAAVGKGVFGMFSNDRTTAQQRELVRDLLSTGGIVLEVATEADIDRITAISGSGPAYVFHFIEALTEAAKRIGLPEDIAAQAARATVFGSASLAEQSAEDAAQLRVNVTSPNGTTAAALDVLMGEGRMTSLMTKAAQAAFDRAQELARD
ncbi:pyrroline-5-carboxylate reductase [Xinfangfangia sp. CPCC 101601]|uniref:Pyrroline-5-carboxylate reductase n=1 Tax=Pseudogemmobacter lacusdianii TaxID=3069608 RepID=A0ABU0W260_9RHOB|nr:pyrroline-5-carboxylate reductase [Xinfangfangia sp. CPCC 101601]MDQ2068105.1 pyrroline-5-carboxylate reductase [Xinfangfangia sp. CPCC 101601]